MLHQFLQDLDSGIAANNMVETCFSYRIIFYINENGKGAKHYIDTTYDSLRESLENIVRNNLTLTNSIVVAAVTTLKDGKCIRLLNRAYGFSLEEYLRRISGDGDNGRNGSVFYGRYAVR